MDKKNLILGIVCLLGAFGLMFVNSRRTAPPPPAPPPTASTFPSAVTPDAEAIGPAAAIASGRPQEAPREAIAESLPDAQPAEAEKPAVAAALPSILPIDSAPPEEPAPEAVLENDFIKVTLTAEGGAIRQVDLKRYSAVQGQPEPYPLNANAPVPALAMAWGGETGTVGLRQSRYRLTEQSFSHAVFTLTVSDILEIVRTYEISKSTDGPDPYLIRQDTRFINRGTKALDMRRWWVNGGTSAPTNADPLGWALNMGVFDGESTHFFNATKFRGSSGFLGLGSRPAISEIRDERKVVWMSVKNQFFTLITTPSEAGEAVLATPVAFPLMKTSGGITSDLRFNLGTLAPATEKILTLEVYAGPKEYPRLSKLKEGQDRVMQFPSGFFSWIGFISKAMLHSLLGIEKLVGNWGVAIILLTIVVRLLFWPLTAKAALASKKMATIQKPLQELREKYKDNPATLQKKTMELFKEHRINPVAGCLPILIQFPIFIALYYMLRSASELRFAGFLWATDLSMPDTVGHLASFPINPMPLLMGISMFFQMRMTPSPSTDAMQQKILQFMPFIFLIFCYNFSSGLVLYWTISNVISILQQIITNRRREAIVIQPAPPNTIKPIKKSRAG